MKRRRWYLHPPIPDSLRRRRPDIPPLLIQLLHNRGLSLDGPWEAFLRADDLGHDPMLLPDMAVAVERLKRAVSSGELVAVYGDFDTDGVTATAVLVQALQRVGARAIPYIPHRREEGYGLNAASLEGLARQGVNVVVTVDCGISSHREVQAARSLGMDVIITDHHAVPDTLPLALAVVDPRRPDSRYPFPDLAGVGVAFKLCQALRQAAQVGSPDHVDGPGIGLTALGTVADMMPLVGENRYLVKQGLKELGQCLGVRELAAVAGLAPGSIDTEAISFALAPRLNAAGRLDHAMKGYRLLTATSPEEARALAGELETLNQERQRLTAEVLAQALECADASQPLIFAAAPGFHAAVAGIVAGKLTDELHRPAVVVEVGPEESRGSCRSIPEFNIVQALAQCRDLFRRYGGHAQAAGFALPTASLPALRERLVALAASELSGVDLRPVLSIDAEVRLRSLGPQLINVVQELAPYGQGNPAPTFLTRRTTLAECSVMGNNGQHLRLRFQEGRSAAWMAVAFDQGGLALPAPSLVDIVYRLEVDRWRGAPQLRLNILDMAPSPS